MAEVIKENSTTKNQPWWHKAIKNFLVVVGLSAVVYAVYKLDLWVVTGLLVVIAILAIAIILLLANLGAYFMKVAEGTTAFISIGDSMKAIVPNVVGYKMSDEKDPESRNWLVPRKDDGKWYRELLWKKLGVRFIGLLWPHTHRHTFDIRSRKRLLEGANVESGVSLKARVVDSPSPEGTTVDSLLFLVPRPVYLDGVQLAGDNSRINLLLLPIYRQVIPVLPAYHLKGDFFTQLDAAIEAAMVDFFATHRVDEDPLTYAHWLKLAKAGGNSPMELHLRTLNVSKKYRDSLGNGELAEYIDDITQKTLADEVPGEAGKIAPLGIIPRFGFALVSFRIVDWEPHKDTENLAKALLAKETELHTAEGVRQKAFGERDAAKARAEGDTNRFAMPVEALVKLKVDPNIAANVLATQLRTENIRDSKVTTYVEGGASASVMVNASPPTSTK